MNVHELQNDAVIRCFLSLPPVAEGAGGGATCCLVPELQGGAEVPRQAGGQEAAGQRDSADSETGETQVRHTPTDPVL